ncbi:MAG: hypothetical protein WBC51_17185 [Vicinamibacterales bacterium]
MSDLSRRLFVTGSAYLLAILVLILSEAPLGSPVFFACAATMTVGYVVMLRGMAGRPPASRRLLLTAFLFALAFRIPPALAPVGADSDMVRYIWDGRVQRYGFSPYEVVPSDPRVAHTHTDETRRMPSLRTMTPYPPGAQLFFRLVVSIGESPIFMKIALVLCDLLTIAVLWRWLVALDLSPWLALIYAWNPLVILEVAHSGHIDALGALWICASAYFLTRQRTRLATLTLVFAIATKLLPIVLVPLYWRRIRWTDGALALAVGTLIYLPFSDGFRPPLGAVPSVVAHVRFNGPVFRTIAAVAPPQVAAGFALLAGVAVAVWARKRLGRSTPAAWAWPMAVSLICAPVIYPWYLLYFTPFLWSRGNVPLLVWTLTSLPVYLVWERSRHGARWIVPWWIELPEFGLFLLATALVLGIRASRSERLPIDELV